jgi:hypothetical protein
MTIEPKANASTPCMRPGCTEATRRACAIVPALFLEEIPVRHRIARWRRTTATVGLAALHACASLGPRPSAMLTRASDDAVVAAPVCVQQPGHNRAVTGGFFIIGAFLGILVAGPKASRATMQRDLVIGMVLGVAVGTYLETHPRNCLGIEDSLAH